jgi:hypothetical protein
MVETLASAAVVAIVGTLWRLSVEHAGMRASFNQFAKSVENGMGQLVDHMAGLRTELSRDISRLEDHIADHEDRLRKLEQDS